MHTSLILTESSLELSSFVLRQYQSPAVVDSGETLCFESSSVFRLYLSVGVCSVAGVGLTIIDHTRCYLGYTAAGTLSFSRSTQHLLIMVNGMDQPSLRYT